MIDVQRHRFAIVGVLPREFNGWRADMTPDVPIPWRTFAALVNFPAEMTSFRSGRPAQTGDFALSGSIRVPVAVALDNSGLLPGHQ